MNAFLARTGYTLLLYLALPILFVKRWKDHRKQPSTSSLWQSRFGMGIQALRRDAQTKPCLLVHCVSVGEVTAANALIKSLLSDYCVVITTTTQTGADQVQNLFGESVTHYFLPLDLPWMMRRLLSKLKPQKVLIMEVELWPNMLRACAQHNIPVLVLNARMTDRSAKTYARIPALFQPMLSTLAHVCAQGERDYQNYLALGLDEGKLSLTQNLKFDLSNTDVTPQQAWLNSINPNNRPLLLAGSTHEPEEAMLLKAYHTLSKYHRDLLLILVPRHPQRFEAVYKLCETAGLMAHKSSNGQTPDQTQVLVVDEMGRLSALYSRADLTFVGGSFAPRGGHNALEAANFAVPIIMGPSQHNNPVICQTLADAGALVTVNDQAELEQQLNQWLTDREASTQAGAAGKQVIEENRGALAKTLAVLSSF